MADVAEFMMNWEKLESVEWIPTGEEKVLCRSLSFNAVITSGTTELADAEVMTLEVVVDKMPVVCVVEAADRKGVTTSGATKIPNGWAVCIALMGAEAWSPQIAMTTELPTEGKGTLFLTARQNTLALSIYPWYNLPVLNEWYFGVNIFPLSCN